MRRPLQALRRLALFGWALPFFSTLPFVGIPLACHHERIPDIEFRLASPPIKRIFKPTSSLAEYLELPAGGNELRITLASYPLNCEDFRAPATQEILITITLAAPPGSPITTSALAYVEPMVRIGSQSWALPPDGKVQIQEAALDRHGSIQGLLDLEFPGTAQASASRLSGAFKAKLCQVERRAESK